MKTRKLLNELLPDLLLMLISAACLLPFLILISSSLSSNASVIRKGYSLLPVDIDLEAYRYLFGYASGILHALAVSLFVTAAGTAVSLAVTAMAAYPLSRKGLPFRRFFTVYILITMLFNGGMVPTYLIYTQLFHIRNSILALIVPNLLFNGFQVMIMRTFFAASIPEELTEAARMDGAGEIRIFLSVVLGLAKPVFVTVGLMQAVAYWNDWFNSLLYIDRTELMSLQAVLNQMISNVKFLSSLSGSGMGQAAMQAQASLPGTTIRMAIASVGVLPFLLVYPFCQKYLVKGITIGAVKG